LGVRPDKKKESDKGGLTTATRRRGRYKAYPSRLEDRRGTLKGDKIYRDSVKEKGTWRRQLYRHRAGGGERERDSPEIGLESWWGGRKS